MKFLSLSQIFFFLLALCLVSSCTQKRVSMHLNQTQKIPSEEPHVISSLLHMTYMPHAQRMPAHLVITKTVTYRFSSHSHARDFSQELLVYPLMHNLSLVAHVKKNGKIIRKYEALKPKNNILNNKNIYTPARARLSLVVPFLKPSEHEEIVVTTSYNWMDPRWHWPLFMEEASATYYSKISVDVPDGISMRFKTSRMGEPYKLIPSDEAHENNLWSQHDNRRGQGTRFIFEENFGAKNTAKKPADRAQIFLAFDSPSERDKKTFFDSWDSVSNYFYNRIDRYDLPSNAIREFSKEYTKEQENDVEKISRILAFLSHDVEKRNISENFQEQEAQTASKTFLRRYGSPFDIVILAKSMFSSLNINADIIAVSDREHNPRLQDFYSPALFHRVMLAIYDQSQVYYYDPMSKHDRFDQIAPTLQGQAALALKANKSHYFILPYDSPEKNTTRYFYDLKLTKMGTLEGSFALELGGIQADQAKRFISKSTELSALALQNQLQRPTSALKWQKAFLSQEEKEEERQEKTLGQSLTFSGNFAPRLLARSNTQGFLLSVKEIFDPVFLPLIDPAHQAFPSFITLEASVHVPEDFKVAHEEPINFLVDQNGLRARFFVSFEPGTLIFKGESMVSLPRKYEAGSAPLLLPENELAIISTTQGEKTREASAHTPEDS